MSGDYVARLRAFLNHRGAQPWNDTVLLSGGSSGVPDLDGDDLRAALDELERLRARLTEIGETEVEWGYWREDEFIISERQFSAGDVRYYREQSGRPVERRLAGQWREVTDA